MEKSEIRGLNEVSIWEEKYHGKQYQPRGIQKFLEFGAPSFEGNIILDSGELSEYYYRFMRIPLAYGEHKVDVLYGQRFYGTLENKPVTFNQEIHFLCLVIDNDKTVNETMHYTNV